MKQEPLGHLPSQASCRQEALAILEGGGLILHVRKALGKG